MQYIYTLLFCSFFLHTPSYTNDAESKQDIEYSSLPSGTQSTIQQRRQTDDSNTSQAANDGRTLENPNLRQIAASENMKHLFYSPILYYYSLGSAIFWDIGKDKFGLGLAVFPCIAMIATVLESGASTEHDKEFYNLMGKLCTAATAGCASLQAYATIVAHAREKQAVALLKLKRNEEMEQRSFSALEEGLAADTPPN